MAVQECRKRPEATLSQLAVAREYGIPMYQAHTIRQSRYEGYKKWLRLPWVKLDRWFDQQEELRRFESGEERNG